MHSQPQPQTQLATKPRRSAVTHLAGWALLFVSACTARTAADERTIAGSTEPALLEPVDGLTGPAAGAEVSVDCKQRGQTLEGFGASVAWYQDRIIGDTPPGLYPMLFSELGLDILRLRNRFERSDQNDADLTQEQEIVRRATETLGHRPTLLLSSWSPPAALKANHKERCHSNPDCTLVRSGNSFAYPEFADWWRRALEHYARLGLAPDLISLQNEPDFIPPDWEGCKFEKLETPQYPGYGPALKAVHDAVTTLPNPPRIVGPEVLGIHYHRLPEYFAGLDANLLDAAAHHIYERGNDEVWDWRSPGPDSFTDEMEEVRATTGLALFQTEFGTDDDRGHDGGFETAWLIHDSLVVEGASAWLYWELIWPSPGGLVSMTGKAPKPRDQYYSLRHYARYTDPGDVRVGALSEQSGLLASAFEAPDAKRLTVILLNKSDEALDAHVEATDFDAKLTHVVRTVYRAGHSRVWETLAPSPIVRMPARSIATLVWER
jgi:glucuronoarabinoxylan endo-1,4-beta-xylanase